MHWYGWGLGREPESRVQIWCTVHTSTLQRVSNVQLYPTTDLVNHFQSCSSVLQLNQVNYWRVQHRFQVRSVLLDFAIRLLSQLCLIRYPNHNQDLDWQQTWTVFKNADWLLRWLDYLDICLSWYAWNLQSKWKYWVDPLEIRSMDIWSWYLLPRWGSIQPSYLFPWPVSILLLP